MISRTRALNSTVIFSAFLTNWTLALFKYDQWAMSLRVDFQTDSRLFSIQRVPNLHHWCFPVFKWFGKARNLWTVRKATSGTFFPSCQISFTKKKKNRFTKTINFCWLVPKLPNSSTNFCILLCVTELEDKEKKTLTGAVFFILLPKMNR